MVNGNWATNLVVTLYGFDAGTDSGASYASPDQATVPRGVVTRFTAFPAVQNGIIVPFGNFSRLRGWIEGKSECGPGDVSRDEKSHRHSRWFTQVDPNTVAAKA